MPEKTPRYNPKDKILWFLKLRYDCANIQAKACKPISHHVCSTTNMGKNFSSDMWQHNLGVFHYRTDKIPIHSSSPQTKDDLERIALKKQN